MGNIKYKRVLVKLSGEALANTVETKDGQNVSYGINFDVAESVCENIKRCVDEGVQVAVVIGAGNFWRGRQAGEMDAARADRMGMLATMINCLGLQDVLEKQGVKAKTLSAIGCDPAYTPERARELLEQGYVVLIGGGTGNPFFTTDTAAALRAGEILADVVLMAKNVDYIYSADPKLDPNAIRYTHLSYKKIIDDQLKAIDLAAAILCKEKNIPTLVFKLGNGEGIYDAVTSAVTGTLLDNNE